MGIDLRLCIVCFESERYLRCAVGPHSGVPSWTGRYGRGTGKRLKVKPEYAVSKRWVRMFATLTMVQE